MQGSAAVANRQRACAVAWTFHWLGALGMKILKNAVVQAWPRRNGVPKSQRAEGQSGLGTWVAQGQSQRPGNTLAAARGNAVWMVWAGCPVLRRSQEIITPMQHTQRSLGSVPYGKLGPYVVCSAERDHMVLARPTNPTLHAWSQCMGPDEHEQQPNELVASLRAPISLAKSWT